MRRIDRTVLAIALVVVAIMSAVMLLTRGNGSDDGARTAAASVPPAIRPVAAPSGFELSLREREQAFRAGPASGRPARTGSVRSTAGAANAGAPAGRTAAPRPAPVLRGCQGASLLGSVLGLLGSLLGGGAPGC